MTVQQIKQAVNNGLKVHWLDENYKVVKVDNKYLIQYQDFKPVLRLHRIEGEYLNGKEKDFFINQ